MSEKTSASNYDLYKVFLYVARYKSLTKAALELNVSQPAISQSMKLLEANLGVKLTKRTGHGIKLTEEGELLFPYVKKGCDAFSQGERALLRYAENSAKKETGDDKTKEEIRHTVEFERDCFVTGTQYSHFTGQKLPYRLLGHLPIILTKNDDTRENINNYLKSIKVTITPVAEYLTPEEVLDHVIHNDGIGCVPYELVKSAVKARDAYILEFEEPIPERVKTK